MTTKLGTERCRDLVGHQRAFIAPLLELGRESQAACWRIGIKANLMNSASVGAAFDLWPYATDAAQIWLRLI